MALIKHSSQVFSTYLWVLEYTISDSVNYTKIWCYVAISINRFSCNLSINIHIKFAIYSLVGNVNMCAVYIWTIFSSYMPVISTTGNMVNNLGPISEPRGTTYRRKGMWLIQTDHRYRCTCYVLISHTSQSWCSARTSWFTHIRLVVRNIGVQIENTLNKGMQV